jgi:hypothetical protein
MANELNGSVVAILAADGVERVELEEPCGALLAAGARRRSATGRGRWRRPTSSADAA